MEAPQCKICGERHYGMCVAQPWLRAKSPVITSRIEQRAKKKSSGVATCPADGEAGVVPLNTPAKPRSAKLHATLYHPDGTINEAAARAGHNAYMVLLMRKRRAAKKVVT